METGTKVTTAKLAKYEALKNELEQTKASLKEAKAQLKADIVNKLSPLFKVEDVINEKELEKRLATILVCLIIESGIKKTTQKLKTMQFGLKNDPETWYSFCEMLLNMPETNKEAEAMQAKNATTAKKASKASTAKNATTAKKASKASTAKKATTAKKS